MRQARIERESSMESTGLNFVVVHVSDLAAARDFYTEKLGLVVNNEDPGFITFVQPGGAGATFALQEDAPARAFEQPELWWYVKNADAAHAALAAKHVELGPLVDQPFGRTFTFQDPAGNTLYVLQPVIA